MECLRRGLGDTLLLLERNQSRARHVTLSADLPAGDEIESIYMNYLYDREPNYLYDRELSQNEDVDDDYDDDDGDDDESFIIYTRW